MNGGLRRSRDWRDAKIQASSSGVCSSMFMSLNSLDSKISPHSLHSTNSDSSSRLTICTRGCLQGWRCTTFCGGAGNLGVINPEGHEKKHEAWISPEFPVF